MFFLVYRTTNKVNHKTYIGSHKTEDKNDSYMGSGKLVLAAIKKYGRESFRKDILFEANSPEEMFAKEKELVVLGSQSYNLKEGGYGGAYGPVSAATRAKLSARSKMIQSSPEFRRRMSMSCATSERVQEHLSNLNAPRIAMKHSSDERKELNTQAQRRCRARRKENQK